MTVTINAFANSPDRGRGLARDMPVRWALEEVGQPYAVRPVTFAELAGPDHRARNPFGQIPTYAEEGLTLFESGAIVLHIAQRWPGLLPAEPSGRARATAWMFAATSTLDPPIMEWSMARVLESDQPWFAERQAMLEERVRRRLDQLAARLGEAEWLDGDFSAGDLLLISVLRRLGGSDLLAASPTVAAYVTRGEARPAFQRAFAAQRAAFEAGQPGP